MQPIQSDGRLRWKIAILLFAAIAISYFDRQTLPVAIASIQKEIPISNTQFSQLQAAFLFAYALMYAGGGKLIDTLGTRRGFLVIMIWWSLACATHGLAGGFAVLAVSRFLLGMGEGGGFPAATKAVAEWFPAQERSTAMGIINAGTALGAVLAPPLIALVIGVLNWRWVFFLAGAVGLAWTAWWMVRYYPPYSHPRLTARERAEIPEVLKAGYSEPGIGCFAFSLSRRFGDWFRPNSSVTPHGTSICSGCQNTYTTFEDSTQKASATTPGSLTRRQASAA